MNTTNTFVKLVSLMLKKPVYKKLHTYIKAAMKDVKYFFLEVYFNVNKYETC